MLRFANCDAVAVSASSNVLRKQVGQTRSALAARLLQGRSKRLQREGAQVASAPLFRQIGHAVPHDYLHASPWPGRCRKGLHEQTDSRVVKDVQSATLGP